MDVKLKAPNGTVVVLGRDADAAPLLANGFAQVGVEAEPGADEGGGKPVSQMNKGELQAYADKNGIDYAEGATKAELLEAIKGE